MKNSLFLLFFCLLQLMLANCSAPPVEPEKVLRGSWTHYKRTFIKEGRVVRPENNGDTVSEGQAYAMLRAVLMDDKKTFDDCLAWTESNLSRRSSMGDALLAWHYQNAQISDKTAASDADIDYGYALLLASRKWHNKNYQDLAQEVLQAILDHETVVIEGRLYLLPYTTVDGSVTKPVAQNPSYYAPSHFKLFYEISGDRRWLDLADTGYELIGRLQRYAGDRQRPALVPDWCALGPKGEIVHLPGKPMIYGWDALRVPIRIAADYQLNGDPRALPVLKRFALFFENEFNKNGKIYGEYSCERDLWRPYENSLFYTAAYAATRSAGFSIASAILNKQRASLRFDGKECFYNEPKDYYVNSLAWLTEYWQRTKTKDNP